ncbi:protein-methionine-sulfoxide reductase heme-binding subunit MsrQ [Ideonella sp. DXS22W]|uniref:Protein-methionine-sulfoxide reductase heme-binding subunit MsrQ n=1 Tax=Pseudaquabacterium inlustre TaxID=2984192 RepID=A0ABU9CE85_9BURK
MNKLLSHAAARPLLFVLMLLPAAQLVWGAFANTLGPNPAEALIRGSGDWVLRSLVLALAVTPLREALGWTALARWRRMLGLFAFFYGVLHFLCYAWLDMGFAADDIVRDIAKRPFILVGTAALLVMVPLAATSFNAAIRMLGAARWKALHRGVFVAVGLALLHFFWMRAAKQNFGEWSVYAGLVALLLGWRLWRWRARPAPGVQASHPARQRAAAPRAQGGRAVGPPP